MNKRWLCGAVTMVVFATALQLVTPAAQAQDVQAPVVEVVLPARVEAENFDAGGAGVAWEDSDVENFGEVRLGDQVDTYRRPRSGASGGDLIGRTRDGEWLEYTVEVVELAEFEVRVTVASGSPIAGTVNIDVDGRRVGGVSGATNRWFDWTTRSAGTVTLGAGSHVVRMSFADGAAVNVDRLDFVPTGTAVPTCATGRQQAELATLAGRFVAVDDADASGTGYVGVPKGEGGRFAGASDDFVEFCVGVAERGVYEIEATLRTPSAQDNSFFVAVDDGELVDFVAEVTGDAFANDRVNDAPRLDQLRDGDVSGPTVDAMTWNLDQGDHTVRFSVRRDGAQLDAIRLVRVGDWPVEPLEPLGGDPLRFWNGVGPTIELAPGETAAGTVSYDCFKCFGEDDYPASVDGLAQGLIQLGAPQSGSGANGNERWIIPYTVTAPPADADTPDRRVVMGTFVLVDFFGNIEGSLPVRVVVTIP